jgi:hypothetical protein
LACIELQRSVEQGAIDGSLSQKTQKEDGMPINGTAHLDPDRALRIAAAAAVFVRVMNDVEETVTTRAQRRRDQQAAYDALVEAVSLAATEREAVHATDS